MKKLKRLASVITPIRDETVIERAIIPHAFRELADIAASMCLSQPLERIAPLVSPITHPTEGGFYYLT